MVLKPCAALMTVLRWQTMAHRVSGSEEWHQLRAIAHLNLVGPSSRMQNQWRMCPASASPKLFRLLLVMGKRCRSVLDGLVGWRTVRNLLPLESEVLLYLLCLLKWEASSSLSP